MKFLNTIALKMKTATALSVVAVTLGLIAVAMGLQASAKGEELDELRKEYDDHIEFFRKRWKAVGNQLYTHDSKISAYVEHLQSTGYGLDALKKRVYELEKLTREGTYDIKEMNKEIRSLKREAESLRTKVDRLRRGY